MYRPEVFAELYLIVPSYGYSFYKEMENIFYTHNQKLIYLFRNNKICFQLDINKYYYLLFYQYLII